MVRACVPDKTSCFYLYAQNHYYDMLTKRCEVPLAGTNAGRTCDVRRFSEQARELIQMADNLALVLHVRLSDALSVVLPSTLVHLVWEYAVFAPLRLMPPSSNGGSSSSDGNSSSNSGNNSSSNSSGNSGNSSASSSDVVAMKDD